MKKRIFSLFLILALVLTALAGCGQDNGGSKKSSDDDGEESERLLVKGVYKITDEDDELVGYLEVKRSEIIVYDEDAEEEDTLSYEYNESKDRYDLDGGELFGGDRFTVEKNKKKLTLITKDKDEYTLEDIGELPGEEPGPDEPDEPDEPDNNDYIELPTGCYAVYDGRALQGYMKVTKRTMISYTSNGLEEQEMNYSYERDGGCSLETDYYGYTVFFTYDRGDYYMSDEFDSSVRLEPIDEDEIPVFEEEDITSGGIGTALPDDYIGGNGSIGLYLWLPPEMYRDMDIDYDDDNMIAMADYYDYANDSELVFYGILSSGDSLQAVISEAWDNTAGDFGAVDELLFAFLRDSIFTNLLEELGGETDYAFDEGNVTINSRNWRYCDLYAEDGGQQVYMAMLLWMDGDNLAVVFVGGNAEDYSGPYDDISDFILNEIIDTLRLDA